jgi:hypothetical protein
MLDYNTFVDQWRLEEEIGMDMARSVLYKAEKIGIIQMTKRQFSDIKSVTFLSLRFEQLSLESLLWTLRSLRKDEMLPSERAIQSRMKEAFDLKPSSA